MTRRLYCVEAPILIERFQPLMQQHAMAPTGPSTLAAGPFSHSHYRIKRPFLSFFSRQFRVFAPDGSLVMIVKHPIFKLREEWQVFADEAQTRPLLTIKTRELIALNRTTDVRDASTGELIATMRSRGLKSIIRDTWDLLDSAEQPFGLVTEDSNALLRRFIPLLLGKWHIEQRGERVANVDQVFTIFTKEFVLDLTPGQGRVDPRMALACALLALMKEIQREQGS